MDQKQSGDIKRTASVVHWWKHGFLLGLVFLAHSFANQLWLDRDNQPPLWDMALHQTAGLGYLDYFAGRQTLQSRSDWWSISGAYPPLYHHLLALAFLVGRNSDAAVLANLPATFLLILGTYLLGCRLFSARVGVLASIALLGIPFMSWMSRETITDYTLAAMVLWSFLCLECSEAYTRRGWTLAFGLFASLSALTKWIGPLFLVLPAAWLWRRTSGRDSSPRLTNLLDALILGGVTTAWWYLPKLPEIMAFLKQNSLIGAAEGEPPILSFQGVIYYLRLLEGIQLQAIFFILMSLGWVYSWRRRSRGAALLFVYVLSGYCGLTLLRTKDPRFTLPFLPVLALVCVCWVEAVSRPWLRNVVSLVLIIFSAGSYTLTSFGFESLPREVLLLKGYQGSYSWDWKLYSQNYFGLLGPPAHAVWPQEELLRSISEGRSPDQIVNLGIVPDLPRFNHENVRLEARLQGLPVHVQRISKLSGEGKSLLGSMNFVVVAEGEQGMKWSTLSNRLINAYIFSNPVKFRIHGFVKMPDGQTLRIYKVQGS